MIWLKLIFCRNMSNLAENVQRENKIANLDALFDQAQRYITRYKRISVKQLDPIIESIEKEGTVHLQFYSTMSIHNHLRYLNVELYRIVQCHISVKLDIRPIRVKIPSNICVTLTLQWSSITLIHARHILLQLSWKYPVILDCFTRNTFTRSSSHFSYGANQRQ